MYTTGAWVFVLALTVFLVAAAFQETTVRGASTCFAAAIVHAFGVWLGYMAGGE